MFEGLRPAAYIVIFLLIAIWVYYRMFVSRKKRGQHGRDLWYGRFDERRRGRLGGAASWEERQRRQASAAPARKIARRYLQETKDGEDCGENGAG